MLLSLCLNKKKGGNDEQQLKTEEKKEKKKANETQTRLKKTGVTEKPLSE